MMNSRTMRYDEVLSALNSIKSPGYPWTLKHRYKYDYWVSPDHLFFDKYNASLRTTTPIQTLASVSIKEELRDAEKVKDNNARTTVSADVNHLVAHNMLVMDQNNRLLENYLKCSSALGLSLFYGGAQKLFQYMTPWGDIPCIMSIDGKQFDSSFHTLAFDVIYDFRFDCLLPEVKLRDDGVYRSLHEIKRQIYGSVLVDVDGHLYRKETGNSSGQGSTTQDNILKNWLDFFVLWLMSVPNEYRTYDAFKVYTRCAFVGDDAMIAVHPRFHNYYNCKTILDNAPRIDMRYEFECDGKFERFENLSFVGHRYKPVLTPSGVTTYLPHIDCEKMRTSMVRYNVDGDILNSIVRCNGLRDETFACESCRLWFSDLHSFLVAQLPVPYSRKAMLALSTHFSDDQLWRLYTDVMSPDIYVCKARPPGDKNQNLPDTMSAQAKITKKGPKQGKKKLMKGTKPTRLTNDHGYAPPLPAWPGNYAPPVPEWPGNYRPPTPAWPPAKPKPKIAKHMDIFNKGIRGIQDITNKAWNVIDTDVKSEGIVNKGAKFLGNLVGSELGVGRQVGNAASYLARIFGFGDYQVGDQKVINHKYHVKHNSFIGSSPPTFSGSSGEDIIVTRREFVKDIYSSTTFANERFFLNPGNPILFPWLSQFAKGYEEYQIMGMVFEFKSTSSDAISSGLGMGSVIAATDYDCLDATYTDKRTMAASEFSNSCKPSISFLHPIECDPKRNVLGRMYVLPGITDVSQVTSPTSSMDPRFATLGQTYIAVEGMAAADSAIGELWVTYKVKLSRPILEAASVYEGLAQRIQLETDTGGNVTSAPTMESRGGVGFSIGNVIQTPTIAPTSGTRLELKLQPSSPGNFMVHVFSTSKSSPVTNTVWAAHNNVYITGMIFDEWVCPQLANKHYVVSGRGAFTENGDPHYHYTSTCVGRVSGGATITVPVFVNTNGGAYTTVYITSVPSATVSTSRLRTELNRVISLNHQNDLMKSSVYEAPSEDSDDDDNLLSRRRPHPKQRRRRMLRSSEDDNCPEKTEEKSSSSSSMSVSEGSIPVGILMTTTRAANRIMRGDDPNDDEDDNTTETPETLELSKNEVEDFIAWKNSRKGASQ